ncbi:MAG: hypothetical protein NC830_00515, partial [Candidatus Omnitrophica bacterium]|nr:hypothetical protein [Candidatus Omnitrophota bacterium]
KEISSLDLTSAGEILFTSGIMAKSWERYAVHAIEGLYAITGESVRSVFNIGDEKLNLAHLEFKSGKTALLQVVYYSTIFGRYDIFCQNSTITIETKDYFHMFKRQLEEFIKFVKTGKLPFPFSQTVEIIKVVIAGIKSRERKARAFLEEIKLEG